MSSGGVSSPHQQGEPDTPMVGFDVPGIILRCRRAADLSQRDLAMRLGVCPSTVARWETGSRMPAADMLAAVAEIAGLRMGLFDTDEQPVSAAPSETLRDRAGRRMPAHLDVHLWDELMYCGRLNPPEPCPPETWGAISMRRIHAPRRRLRDWRREHMVTRHPQREPGGTPFHVVGRGRWLTDVSNPRDYANWRAALDAARKAEIAERLARHPVPEPEPCFCEDLCFEMPLCVAQCPCQCESYGVVVA